MLKNNKFFIKRLKNIIFLGHWNYYDEIEDNCQKIEFSLVTRALKASEIWVILSLTYSAMRYYLSMPAPL